MRFYNHERPHYGYRVRGKTPATLLHGAVALVGYPHDPLWDGNGVNTVLTLDTLRPTFRPCPTCGSRSQTFL